MREKTSPLSAYKKALGTRPPHHAVVGLYDLVIVHILKAADAAQQQDYERQFNEAMIAAKVLNGLNGCLDMKRGGSVAVSLREMYQSLVSALLRTIAKKTGAVACVRLAEAVRLTRNAWAEIAMLPLSVKPMEITAVAKAEAPATFTRRKQSVMNNTRQG
jgi:flagellar biosynthetic protein FliS